MDRSRQRSSGWVGGAVVGVSIIAAAAIVLAAQGFVASAVDAGAQDTAPVKQSTKIEVGPVIKTVQGSVTTSPAGTWEVQNLVTSTGARIYTRAGLTRGTTVSEGNVIATISERPVIALSSSTPFFRALSVGDTGADVAGLQSALRRLGYTIPWDPDGTYGPFTAEAVYALYRDRHYQPVGASEQALKSYESYKAAAPLGELFALPSSSVRTADSCGSIGSSATNTICTLVATSTDATVSFSSVDADSVHTGAAASLALDAGTHVDAKIGAVTSATQASSGGSSDGKNSSDTSSDGSTASTVSGGSTVSFSLVLAKPLPEGSTGTGTVVLRRSPDNALRVLQTAVRTGSDGSTWLVSLSGTRADVSLGICAGGYCEVSGVAIRSGQRVQLPSTMPNGTN